MVGITQSFAAKLSNVGAPKLQHSLINKMRASSEIETLVHAFAGGGYTVSFGLPNEDCQSKQSLIRDRISSISPCANFWPVLETNHNATPATRPSKMNQ